MFPLSMILSDPKVLKEEYKRAWGEWKARVQKFEGLQAEAEQKLEELHKRRRLLSIQHEQGIIDETELMKRWAKIKDDISMQERAVRELVNLTSPEAPFMDPQRFAINKGAISWDFMDMYMNMDNEELIKLADKLDLTVQVRSKEDIEITARLPIDINLSFKTRFGASIAVASVLPSSTIRLRQDCSDMPTIPSTPQASSASLG